MADCNITKYHGDTWELAVAVTDDATPPVAINLTGATIEFVLETESATVDDFYFSDPVGGTPNTAGISIVRTDLAGEFTLTLTDALMVTLSPANQYLCDVTTTAATGEVLTLFVLALGVLEKA